MRGTRKSIGRQIRSGITVIKNVARTAFEPFQKVFQGFEGHVLLAHFHPVQRGRRDADFSRKSGIAHFPALFPKELPQLFL